MSSLSSHHSELRCSRYHSQAQATQKLRHILSWIETNCVHKTESLQQDTFFPLPLQCTTLGSNEAQNKKQRAFSKGNHPITCLQSHCLPVKPTTPRCRGGQPPAQAPPLPSTLRDSPAPCFHSHLQSYKHMDHTRCLFWSSEFVFQQQGLIHFNEVRISL